MDGKLGEEVVCVPIRQQKSYMLGPLFFANQIPFGREEVDLFDFSTQSDLLCIFLDIIQNRIGMTYSLKLFVWASLV